MPLQNPQQKIGSIEEDPHSIDADGFERMQGIRTPDRSPDGAPGDPEVGQGSIGWMLVGSVAAVIIISLVVMAFFGPMIGLLSLILLMALAVVANPVVWSAILRGRERGPEAKPEER